ncbi:hypothetical protein [Marinobacter sp. X15-166B]|uniref:hypothetical protein n=1 Tax=Marinobacter sp. X15-166B TaxID=1897620 RepID=UPI00085C4076|nr:hypothetical protein [Marinobacter sp. X15-166B]OEY66415.1 hypothetical protein BG841_08065 [Marinobacter sp. X15-166B]
MIMRWLIRLAFPALGLLVLLIFFGIKDPQSLTNGSAADNTAKQIPAFEGLVPSPTPNTGPSIVFKWQDSSGGWHYADSPPRQGLWNALAIEPGGPAKPPQSDWQAPYQAPFALNPPGFGKDS